MDRQYLMSLLAYDPVTGIFTRKISRGRKHKIGDIAGCKSVYGYIIINVDRKDYRAARLAWLFYYGEWPKEDVDHINRNRADDRIVNLRLATRSQNIANSKLYANNTSGYRGVSWNARQRKWCAQIEHNNRNVIQKFFRSKEEAAIFYKQKAYEIFGAFANVD